MRTLRELGVPEDIEELLQLTNQIVALPSGRLQTFLESRVAPRWTGEQLKKFRSRIGSDVAAVERLRRELLQYIVDRCLSYDRAAARALYGDAVTLLVAKRIPVFTTNYDTVFDLVAEACGITVHDNFVPDGTGRRYFWDPGLQAFRGDGLQLVKIHGCIQWHATAMGRIERIPVPTTRIGMRKGNR